MATCQNWHVWLIWFIVFQIIYQPYIYITKIQLYINVICVSFILIGVIIFVYFIITNNHRLTNHKNNKPKNIINESEIVKLKTINETDTDTINIISDNDNQTNIINNNKNDLININININNKLKEKRKRIYYLDNLRIELIIFVFFNIQLCHLQMLIGITQLVIIIIHFYHLHGQ